MLIALAVATVAACTSLPRSSDPSLADIVRRNTEARGGAAALDRVHRVAIDVEIVEGGQTLNGRYAASADGLVRIDIYAGGRNVYAEGVDRTGVWRWTGGPGPAEPSVASGAANALTNGAENHLFGWHRFAARGHRLAMMPPATIDGRKHPVVEVRYSTGHVSYFTVDPESGQAVRRRDERAYHPDVDPTKKRVETRYSEFTAVGAVTLAHRNDDFDLANGQLLSVNRVLARTINPVLPADYFDRARRAPADW